MRNNINLPKKRLFLLLFVSSILGNTIAQKATPCGDSTTGWNLENGSTMWVHTYSNVVKDSASIAKELSYIAAKIGGLNGLVSGYKLDLSRYTSAEKPLHLMEPANFAYKYIIQDNKYKVFIFGINTTSSIQTTRFYWDTDSYNRKGCIKWAYRGGFTQNLEVFGECMLKLWIPSSPSKPKFDW